MTDANDARWQSILNRDRSADGTFVIGVRTTGIFCRPGCPARTPKRENVEFFDRCTDALRAGYRPCKRCRPLGPSIDDERVEKVRQACSLIDGADERISLAVLADHVGLSPARFQRVFTELVGISPAQYGRQRRADNLRAELDTSRSVTKSTFAAGFASSSTMYAAAVSSLGMSPGSFRKRGAHQHIRYAISECWLGPLLVAWTERGLCMVQFGSTRDELELRVHEQFANAASLTCTDDHDHMIRSVVDHIEHPTGSAGIPLDLMGTAFQQKVWTALQLIPAGTTRTYSDVAEAIGQPKAVRAVASACARNNVAVVVPCHRVVGKNGSLTGYRWGTDRKRALIDREADEAAS